LKNRSIKFRASEIIASIDGCLIYDYRVWIESRPRAAFSFEQLLKGVHFRFWHFSDMPGRSPHVRY
jgi:hypothetical protein